MHPHPTDHPTAVWVDAQLDAVRFTLEAFAAGAELAARLGLAAGQRADVLEQLDDLVALLELARRGYAALPDELAEEMAR